MSRTTPTGVALLPRLQRLRLQRLSAGMAMGSRPTAVAGYKPRPWRWQPLTRPSLAGVLEHELLHLLGVVTAAGQGCADHLEKAQSLPMVPEAGEGFR